MSRLTKYSATLRKIVVMALMLTNILSCWLWWEVHKFTMRWERHGELFPLPFYIAKVPAWFAIDLSVTLIVFSTAALAMLALGKGEG